MGRVIGNAARAHAFTMHWGHVCQDSDSENGKHGGDPFEHALTFRLAHGIVRCRGRGTGAGGDQITITC